METKIFSLYFLLQLQLERSHRTSVFIPFIFIFIINNDSLSDVFDVMLFGRLRVFIAISLLPPYSSLLKTSIAFHLHFIALKMRRPSLFILPASLQSTFHINSSRDACSNFKKIHESNKFSKGGANPEYWAVIDISTVVLTMHFHSFVFDSWHR